MAKWKLVIHKTPMKWDVHQMPVIRLTGLPEFNERVPAIVAYKIESIGGVVWNDIPQGVKETNMNDFRFVAVREGVSIDDFEIEVIE